MHFMNKQREGHIGGKPTDYSQQDPTAAGAPGAGDQPEPTVTITAKADGTYTCDGGDGNPQPYGSIEEALEGAKSLLGGGDEEQDADQGSSAPPAASGSEADDMMGGGGH